MPRSGMGAVESTPHRVLEGSGENVPAPLRVVGTRRGI